MAKPPLLLSHVLCAFLTLLSLLCPAFATVPSAGETGGGSSGVYSQGLSGNPDDDDNSSRGDSDINGSVGNTGSMDLIGYQPATVQLGSGFIVGCVIGVIVYTIWQVSIKIVRRSTAERRAREAEHIMEGVLVEV